MKEVVVEEEDEEEEEEKKKKKKKKKTRERAHGGQTHSNPRAVDACWFFLLLSY